MLDSKLNGWIYEEEAVDIIKYMYNQEDSGLLIEKLINNYTYTKNNALL